MAQIQEQIQTQQQVMQQRLTPQQLLVARLIEMPLAQVEENVRTEIDTNPSLEGSESSDGESLQADNETPLTTEDDGEMDNDTALEREEREDALAEALEEIGADDRMDTEYSDDYKPAAKASDSDSQRQMEDGNLTSFIDILNEQMRMEKLSEKEESILEYLIGSLDDDGLLRKDLMTISDELAIYHYIDASEDEIRKVLRVLQSFDPAGVGAQSLQECLLIQASRKVDSPQKTLLITMLRDHYDDFINNRMAVVQQKMQLKDYQIDDIRKDIRKLNPKPGAALGETEGRSLERITPDFIVNVDYDGHISFEINNGRMPVISVVKEDEEFLQQCLLATQSGAKISKGEQEAMAFTQKNVERARTFVSAMQQRQHTMTITMKAIIELQRRYFQEGDEGDIRPMKLKDISERTGLDLSTISRVCRSKYVQTPWGIFSLRHFFSDSYVTQGGEMLSTKSIKVALKDILAAEDTRHPLSDEKLCTLMKDKGFPIARRTVTKYREQMGIPTARLRKK